MLTESIASGSAPAGASGKTAADAQIGLAENFNGFLRLLTTQLTNQDPLEPLDANEFTAQLVQFTNVEQSIKTNSMLEQLLAVTRSDQLASGADFIGAFVEVDAGTIQVGSSGPSGQASYQLTEPAATVELSIRNESGELVWQGSGNPARGSHEVPWNGLDVTGRRVDPGLYRVEVKAVDGAGRPVAADTAIDGLVEGVEFDGAGGMMLSVGGVLVPSTSVTSLRRPAAA